MNKTDISYILAPGKIGDLEVPNRFVMSSLSRKRADAKTAVPSGIQAEYYAQRATAALVMTEATAIANNGRVFSGACGIYNKEQVEGWKKVTEGVHAKQGKIFVQIWHGGRSVHPDVVGEPSIGPSPIAIKGKNSAGMDFTVPKEMTKEDIQLVLEQYKTAALNSKEAGFDGIELHGATGYLIDQFIRDGANKRTDEYGGSIENRCRLALEAIDIFIEVFGAQRVGIKLSPTSLYLDMIDSDPVATYKYLLEQLSQRGIAYVQLCEPSEGDHQIAEVCKTFRPYFNGAIIANNLFTPETGAQAIESGVCDFISFGRLYIANPDLVERAKNSWPYAKFDPSTLFSPDAKGYTDYPTYKN